MKPKINGTEFGSITINEKTFGHDVIIRLNGEIKKRKKKLSKAVFGSSHKVSLDETRHAYEKGADRLIIGSGQYGVLKLSSEAADFLKKKNCLIELLSTPRAIKIWNEAQDNVIGLFHVTC